MAEQTYDLIIIGAGIAGASLACSLQASGLRIALLDRKPLPVVLDEAIDLRTSAINRGSQALLTKLDAWEEIAKRSSQYKRMFVWNGGGDIAFDCAHLGLPYLGHIIENKVMLTALAHQLLAAKTVDYFDDLTPVSLTSLDDGICLLTEQGERLHAQLVVGADGANSWVRQAAGIEVDQRPYEQTATVVTLRTEKPHQQTAWQHFTPTGPVAFLPLSDPHQCSIVWSQQTEASQATQALSDEEFTKRLNEAFESRLGEIELLSERASFPLVMRHAKSYFTNRVVLLADALHTIHPLAGLGLNLGLRDVACLSELIAQAVAAKQPIASHRLLAKYQRTRKLDNLSVLAAMRGLQCLFSNEDVLLSWLRNVGLNQVDKVQVLKNLIIDAAG